MSPFTIFVLCVQAVLFQVNYGAARSYLLSSPSTVDVYRYKLPCEPTVTSQQCGCGYGLSSFSSAPVYGSSSGSCGYGGEGTGVVSAAGDIQACGTTCVEGAVPVLGSVCFGGCAPACGSVSICGQCGCGCQ